MKTIYKYPIRCVDRQVLKLPEGSRIMFHVFCKEAGNDDIT